MFKEGEIIKILALDQSTKVTGYSTWQDKSLKEYGLLTANPKEKNPIERMREMYTKIVELINTYEPDFVVFEDVQFQNNYGTFQQLSQLQGILMALLFEKDIGFMTVEPTKWKSFCGVKGRKREEQKANCIQMVKTKYKIDVTEDEADAIGIGIWAVNNLLK